MFFSSDRKLCPLTYFCCWLFYALICMMYYVSCNLSYFLSLLLCSWQKPYRMHILSGIWRYGNKCPLFLRLKRFRVMGTFWCRNLSISYRGLEKALYFKLVGQLSFYWCLVAGSFTSESSWQFTWKMFWPRLVLHWHWKWDFSRHLCPYSSV